MRKCYGLILLLLLAGVDLQSASAQNVQRGGAAVGAAADTSRGYRQFQGQPDVMLEVPNLHVDSLGIRVERLEARLALDARVANLVAIRAGADVFIGEVEISLVGVDAEAYLYVFLDDVVTIVNRTLETLDNNPQIIEMLGETLQQTVGTVGDVAGQALGPGGAVSSLTQTLGQAVGDITRPGGLLSQTVNTLGQTVTQTLSTTGDLTETVFNQAGQIVRQQNLGSVTGLTDVVSETAGQAGQTVRRVRNQAGRLIEYTVDQSGRVANARVVQ